MGRRSIWERIESEFNMPREARITLPRSFVQRLVRESTEGPTVSITLPREYAEQILQSLQMSLEIDPDEMGEDGDDLDMGDPGDMDAGGGEDFTADDPTGFIDPDAEPDEGTVGDSDDDEDEDDEPDSDEDDEESDKKKPKSESVRRRGRSLWG